MSSDLARTAAAFGGRVWVGAHRESPPAFTGYNGHPAGVPDTSLGPELDQLADVAEAAPSLADRVSLLEAMAHVHDAPATDLPALNP